MFKRALERNYALKTNAGRAFMSEINNRFPTLGFSLNSFEDEVTAKLGVSESLKHELLNAYPVLTEKKGDLVAQFKITVMILQGGTISITGLPVDLAKFKSENSITDEAILHLLNVRNGVRCRLRWIRLSRGNRRRRRLRKLKRLVRQNRLSQLRPRLRLQPNCPRNLLKNDISLKLWIINYYNGTKKAQCVDFRSYRGSRPGTYHSKEGTRQSLSRKQQVAEDCLCCQKRIVGVGSSERSSSHYQGRQPGLSVRCSEMEVP